MRTSPQPQAAYERRLRVAQVVLLPWRNASVVVCILATIASVALVVGCSDTASISQPNAPSASRCQTALTGVELGYDVHVIVDAVAGETKETHEAAIQRLIQAGVVPVTWLSVASEFQRTYANAKTAQQFVGLMAEHSPSLGLYLQQHAAQQAAAQSA